MFVCFQVKELQGRLANLLTNLEKAVSLASNVIEGRLEVKKYEQEDKTLGEERKKIISSINDILRDL